MSIKNMVIKRLNYKVQDLIKAEYLSLKILRIANYIYNNFLKIFLLGILNQT